MARQTTPMTRVLARALGPYLVLTTVTAITRASDMRLLLSQFASDPVWPWVTGALVLLTGLVVISVQPFERRAASIAVSVLGCLMALKGFMWLAFPAAAASMSETLLSATGWWQALLVLAGAAGFYLIYVGWRPTPARPTSPAESGRATDIPRAA